jgi:hypothetical protein
MAKLSTVLGTVLRDLAHSRVISDTFSRDISVEYEEDPILRLFPVPRIEIKEVTISIPFTVKSVERGEVKTDKVVKPILKSQATKLTDNILSSITIRRKNKEDISKVLEATQAGKKLQKMLEQQLASNMNMISKALKGQREDLNDVLSDAIHKELLADSGRAKELLAGVDEVRFKKMLQKTCDAFLKNVFTKDAQAAIESAGEKATNVDVGVTTDELVGVPETTLTRITVVADVRNYQWTKVEEVEGKPVRHLVPE